MKKNSTLFKILCFAILSTFAFGQDCQVTPTELSNANFDRTGRDGWTGGRLEDDKFAERGNSVQLTVGNGPNRRALKSKELDLSSMSSITVSFHIGASNMDEGEQLLLNLKNGNTTTGLQSWTSTGGLGAPGEGEFSNGAVNKDVIKTTLYNNGTWTSNSRLEFVNGGDGPKDQIYLDNILIMGHPSNELTPLGSHIDGETLPYFNDDGTLHFGRFNRPGRSNTINSREEAYANGGVGNYGMWYRFNTNALVKNYFIEELRGKGNAVQFRGKPNDTGGGIVTESLDLTNAREVHVSFHLANNDKIRPEALFLFQMTYDYQGENTKWENKGRLRGHYINGSRSAVFRSELLGPFTNNMAFRFFTIINNRRGRIFVDNIKVTACGQASVNWPDLLISNRSFEPVLESEPQKEEVISLYPNPTVNSFAVKGDSFKSFEIRNLTGLMVGSGRLNNNKANLSNLPTGSYVIHLRKENGEIAIKKIMIK